MHLICYADDRLLLTGGREWTRTVRLADSGLAAITIKIHGLGLSVAAKKAEAMWFHDLPRSKKPPQTWLTIDREREHEIPRTHSG